MWDVHEESTLHLSSQVAQPPSVFKLGKSTKVTTHSPQTPFLFTEYLFLGLTHELREVIGGI